jgi:uncharacterized protein (TIGR00251 family)
MYMKLSLYIQPNAKKTEIVGRHNGLVKLRVAALPIEGEANKCVIEFIAKTLDVPKSAVKMVSGEKSRVKVFEIGSDCVFDRRRLKVDCVQRSGCLRRFCGCDKETAKQFQQLQNFGWSEPWEAKPT